MTDVMVDLETWGKRPGCAIASIGARAFDPKSNRTFGKPFYQKILVASCREVGLHEDKETLDWWSKQSFEAQNELHRDARDLRDVLTDFSAWWKKVGGTKFWCQGTNFDEPILGAAYWLVGMEQPWKFSLARDTRTAYDPANLDIYDMPRVGTHHNALDDADFQITCVKESYRRIMGALKTDELEDIL